MDTLDNSNMGGSVTLKVYGDSVSRAWSTYLPQEVRTDRKDSTATVNVLEGQRLLDSLVGCADGSSVVAQRKGESVCFQYELIDVGNDGTVTTCKSKCIRLGSSSDFETYDKFETKITGGFNGIPFTVYYFGESRSCRVEVSTGEQTPNESTDNTGSQSLTTPPLTDTQSFTGEDSSSPNSETNDVDESPDSGETLVSTGPDVESPAEDAPSANNEASQTGSSGSSGSTLDSSEVLGP